MIIRGEDIPILRRKSEGGRAGNCRKNRLHVRMRAGARTLSQLSSFPILAGDGVGEGKREDDDEDGDDDDDVRLGGVRATISGQPHPHDLFTGALALARRKLREDKESRKAPKLPPSSSSCPPPPPWPWPPPSTKG